MRLPRFRAPRAKFEIERWVVFSLHHAFGLDRPGWTIKTKVCFLLREEHIWRMVYFGLGGAGIVLDQCKVRGL